MEVPAKCQCRNRITEKPCNNYAVNDSLFCEEHQDCEIAPLNGWEPHYDPNVWSKPEVYKAMNCYAYAMDFRGPEMIEKCRRNNARECRQFFPQPGALNGERNALNAAERRTCPNVEKLMIADVPGIEKSTRNAVCPVGKSKIALVVDKGEDYHFYRQDSNGLWSHKDGGNKIKNYDALNRKIFDPETASRNYTHKGSSLNYDDFCGFYCAPRNYAVYLGQGGALKSLRKKTLKKTVKKTVKTVKKTQKKTLKTVKKTVKKTQKKTL